MTTFLDGAAKGQTLMLKRAPIFLRVVTDGKTWDALDQVTDTMGRGEVAIAYQVKRAGGMVHIRASKGGGFYAMADYAVVVEQPDQATMRDNGRWAAWCEARALAGLAPQPTATEGEA